MELMYELLGLLPSFVGDSSESTTNPILRVLDGTESLWRKSINDAQGYSVGSTRTLKHVILLLRIQRQMDGLVGYFLT